VSVWAARAVDSLESARESHVVARTSLYLAMGTRVIALTPLYRAMGTRVIVLTLLYRAMGARGIALPPLYRAMGARGIALPPLYRAMGTRVIALVNGVIPMTSGGIARKRHFPARYCVVRAIAPRVRARNRLAHGQLTGSAPASGYATTVSRSSVFVTTYALAG